jgi:hypothetical protein
MENGADQYPRKLFIDRPKVFGTRQGRDGVKKRRVKVRPVEVHGPPLVALTISCAHVTWK